MNVPHLQPEEMKDKFIRFRVTEQEHAAFMQQAKSKGYNTFSDYIRALLERDKTQTVEPPFNYVGEEMI